MDKNIVKIIYFLLMLKLICTPFSGHPGKGDFFVKKKNAASFKMQQKMENMKKK